MVHRPAAVRRWNNETIPYEFCGLDETRPSQARPQRLSTSARRLRHGGAGMADPDRNAETD